MGPDPSCFICLLDEYFSHLHVLNLPVPGTEESPPDTSDRPPTFQNCSENPGADVILSTEPNLLHGPHGFRPPFLCFFLPTPSSLLFFRGQASGMVSRTLREQLFLPLLFWAEVLCELEEHGEEGQTRPGGVPPLCAVDAKGLQPGFSWVSRLWPGARQGAFLRLLLGRMRTCHRFPTSTHSSQGCRYSSWTKGTGR